MILTYHAAEGAACVKLIVPDFKENFKSFFKKSRIFSQLFLLTLRSRAYFFLEDMIFSAMLFGTS
jgi:hypothetical protein